VRIARGNHRKTAWRYARVFVMVAVTATASLWLHKSLVPTVAAEPDKVPAEEQAPLADQQPTQTLLQTGEPQSTTAAETKPADTILRWTPTGVGDVQDMYDIRVATDPTVDPAKGELTTAMVKTVDGLVSAEFDARDLPEGVYYWQVRSCSAALPSACHDWSAVWTLRVDATVPVAPTVEFTSETYSQTVSFAGTAEAATTVSVTVGDKTCTATAGENGAWSCTFDGDFEYGDYTATVRTADTAKNVSPDVLLDFNVKELFVAPVITQAELPPVLDIVPVDETPENKVEQKPVTAVIDVVNTGTATDQDISTPTVAIKPLSTDGGIIQSSENGWQIFGLPWFLWAGSGAGLAGAFWAFGVPVPRRLTAMFSL